MDFARMQAEALAFFKELSQDNSKDWFDANRARYKDQIKAPAERFVALMAEALTAEAGAPVSGKLFRANRDVRFSKDKRPYNEHLHMSWSMGEVGMGAPVWFFGLSTQYQTAGYGAFALSGDALSAYRRMIDSQGDALVAAIAASGASVDDHGPEPLKRVPKPYAPDHPHGDLLRRKGLTVACDLAPALSKPGADPYAEALAAFRAMAPIVAIFREFL